MMKLFFSLLLVSLSTKTTLAQETSIPASDAPTPGFTDPPAPTISPTNEIFIRPTAAPVVPPTAAPVPTPDPTAKPPTPFCNICGPGNTMTLPDTDFKYIDALAKEVERPCSQAQFLANLDIAPLGFCEILSTYATGPCGCQYPDGTAIVPQLPAAEWPECNICGPGGQIGDGNAVVPLVNHIELRTLFPCQELQRLANTPNVFPVSFCPSIVEQSLATCRCFTPDDGGLISDKTVVPTSAPVALSPTAGGSAPSQPSAGNNGGGSPTDGSNGSSNNGPTSSNNGGSSDAALSSKSVGSFMCALVVVMSMMML